MLSCSIIIQRPLAYHWHDINNELALLRRMSAYFSFHWVLSAPTFKGLSNRKTGSNINPTDSEPSAQPTAGAARRSSPRAQSPPAGEARSVSTNQDAEQSGISANQWSRCTTHSLLGVDVLLDRAALHWLIHQRLVGSLQERVLLLPGYGLSGSSPKKPHAFAFKPPSRGSQHVCRARETKGQQTGNTL